MRNVEPRFESLLSRRGEAGLIRQAGMLLEESRLERLNIARRAGRIDNERKPASLGLNGAFLLIPAASNLFDQFDHKEDEGATGQRPNHNEDLMDGALFQPGCSPLRRKDVPPELPPWWRT